MKSSNFAKSVWLGTIAASLVALPLSFAASAQTGTSPGTAPDTVTPTDPAPGITDPTGETGVVTTEAEDDDFDWGWLGLLGLAGLAGLKGKSDDRTRYRDPSADPRTTAPSDYR